MNIAAATLERERRTLAWLASAYLLVAAEVRRGRAVAVALRPFEADALFLARLLAGWGRPPTEARPS